MDRRAASPDYCILLFFLLGIVSRTTGTILFPDTEPCKLRTGEKGLCLPIADCPLLGKLEVPVTCGFDGFNPIVCCPKTQDNTTDDPSPDKQQDISSPSGYDNLNCGKSAVKITLGIGFPFASRSKRASKLSAAQQFPASSPVPPVVGGVRSERAAWPWMALLGERNNFGVNWFCGGALINDRWVLTALHCFHDFKAEVVRLGEHDYANDRDEADYEDLGVEELVLYPEYKFREAYHDLALLKLNRTVTLQKFILPVCLPWGEKSEENIVNTLATVVGWGHTLYGGFPSSVLMEAEVEVFPSSRCDSSYSTLLHYSRTWPQGIGEETVCAGDPEGGKDSCQGDSGGPLVTRNSEGRYVAAGIVSQGQGCGLKDFPGLYMNLRYPPYLAWVKKIAFGAQ